MRLLALLKPALTGASGARVAMAVAASAAVTAGVTAPMAHQAIEARNEQAAAEHLLDENTALAAADPGGSGAGGAAGPTGSSGDPTTNPTSTTTSTTTLPPTSTTVPGDAPVITTLSGVDVPFIGPLPPSGPPPTVGTTTTVPPTTAAPTTVFVPGTTTTTATPTTTSTTANPTTTTTATTTTSTTSTTTTTVPAHSESIYLSLQPDRSSPRLLQGETVSGIVYIFVAWTGADEVHFWIDDVTMSGPATENEYIDPFDLAKTAPDDTAFPFDVSTLGAGEHTLTVTITDQGAVHVQTATFVVV